MNTNNYINLYCDTYKYCEHSSVCLCGKGEPWIVKLDSYFIDTPSLINGAEYDCGGGHMTTFSTSPFISIVKEKLNGKI